MRDNTTMVTTTAALRWPLKVGPDGRFLLCGSREEGWSQRVAAVVSTRLSERVMRTGYGCTLPDDLFSALPDNEPNRAIRQAINQWLPAITVLDVRVITSAPDVLVEVDYLVPGGTEQTMHASFTTPLDEPK